MTTNTRVHGSVVGSRLARRVALPLLLGGMTALPACDILDVNNPNNLVEESIRATTAASAVVNGALALTADAISGIWQPYLIASDELTWIGSRDAWGELDNGFVSNFNNEFTDGVFPALGRARWMADEAVKILTKHVADCAAPACGASQLKSFKTDLARGNFVSGMIYMIIGEVQEDFAFSNKQEAAPPVGPSNMFKVLDDAIARLDKAISGAKEVGNADLELRALAVRARAKHSRAIWDKIKPSPKTNAPLVASAGATADAAAVIAKVGTTSDWTYKLQFSSSTINNDMASWINGRAENQFDFNIIQVDPKIVKKIQGVKLRDPILNAPDPVILAKINEWKDGDFKNDGTSYAPLTVASARMMHLILAEDALSKGDNAGHTLHINHVRDMDGITRYSGQIPAMDILKHERRVNLFLMGLRLADMYRFGIKDPLWLPNSDASQKPGSLLPITIIERRANPFLKGSG